MIRTIWAYLVAGLGTAFWGIITIACATLRVRSTRLYNRLTVKWARTLLRGSGSWVRVHGLDRVDWSQPAVLVANHVGSFEILGLAVSIPVPYYFVAKKELEAIPIFGRAWKAAGHISIDRENRQKALESLRQAAETMHRTRGIVIIFPEGTRSRTGELQPFKKGAFQLAISAGVPIIPTIVTGSEEIMPHGSWRVRPGIMDIYIGDPVPIDGYAPEDVDRLIELVHGRMREMLRQGREERRLAAAK